MIKGRLCDEDWPRVFRQMTIVRRCLTKGPTGKGRYDGGRAKEDAMADAQRKI